MSALPNALQQVGYEPTMRQRKNFAQILDEVIAPLTRYRKVNVRKTGGMYRVRFEGRATNALGSTIVEAKKRLRILDNKP